MEWMWIFVSFCLAAIIYWLFTLISYVWRLAKVPNNPQLIWPQSFGGIYSEKLIPPHVDVVVIGSGISGMTVAAFLAKRGRKVLVLEQHEELGGSCHTFREHGIDFDTGLHYVGEMQFGSECRTVADYISEGRLAWKRVDTDIVDLVNIGSELQFPIMAGWKRFGSTLTNLFPSEAGAIAQYVRLIHKNQMAIWPLGVLKMAPHWVCRLLLKLDFCFKPYRSFSGRSIETVLNALTQNSLLKAVLSYNYGDLGVPPSRLLANLQMIVMRHFVSHGSFYPVGGGRAIPASIVPTIEAAGGAVLCRASVHQILVDETNTAIGVLVQKRPAGGDVAFVPCGTVVAACGVQNTAARLLVPSVARASTYFGRLLQSPAPLLRRGITGFSVFVSLRQSADALRLPQFNHWIYENENTSRALDDYLDLPVEEAVNVVPPLMFASFPSAKDPTWPQRFPGRSNVILIGMARFDWFQQWQHERVMHRGADYEALKKAFERAYIDRFLDFYPHLRDEIDHVTVGTPLSNQYYLGYPDGEIYGADLTAERFTPFGVYCLRPDTDIRGLFLTGQDLLTPGVCGALTAGVFTAQAVLGESVFLHVQLASAVQTARSWLRRARGATADGAAAAASRARNGLVRPSNGAASSPTGLHDKNKL